MKKIQHNFWKMLIIVGAAVSVPAFIAGWLVAVNFSGVFETGYKIALLDLKAGIREAIKDRQPYFYMEGIRFYPVLMKNVKNVNAETQVNVIAITDTQHITP